jgi:hypothetical protein
MTEMKWWPPGVIPDVDGEYVIVLDGCKGFREITPLNRSVSERDARYYPSRQYIGPLNLPAEPKSPPKLRRFTAKYRKSGRDVSGVQMEGRDIVSTFSRDTGDSGCWSSGCELDELIITEWLDPE